MNVAYDPAFVKKLKKIDIRVRNNVKEKILLFSKEPQNLSLNNHSLRDEYRGYRSIDITGDWRAIFRVEFVGEERIAYFTNIGTHKELYG